MQSHQTAECARPARQRLRSCRPHAAPGLQRCPSTISTSILRRAVSATCNLQASLQDQRWFCTLLQDLRFLLAIVHDADITVGIPVRPHNQTDPTLLMRSTAHSQSLHEIWRTATPLGIVTGCGSTSHGPPSEPIPNHRKDSAQGLIVVAAAAPAACVAPAARSQICRPLKSPTPVSPVVAWVERPRRLLPSKRLSCKG